MAHEDEFEISFFKSQKWMDLYAVDGPFNGDKRCLSLTICANGFDPFNHLKVQYSMTPDKIIECVFVSYLI